MYHKLDFLIFDPLEALVYMLLNHQNCLNHHYQYPRCLHYYYYYYYYCYCYFEEVVVHDVNYSYYLLYYYSNGVVIVVALICH